MKKLSLVLGGVALAGLLAPAAMAADLGSATAVSGSVMVQRAGQMSALKAGAALAEGDMVISRSDGSATLTFGACSLSLTGSSSLRVTAEVCASGPNAMETLAPEPQVAGEAVGAGIAPGTSVMGPFGWVVATVTTTGLVWAVDDVAENPAQDDASPS